MTSRYHGSRISGSQQSVMTETAICVVEPWKETLGYHFVPECNHAQESCMPNFFVSVLFFFPDIFARPRFVEIQKFCYHGNKT